ncbi:hypothetical protein [Photorhabdus australis]|uniref:hypothetical protein n=1 Tax=Photorhabdus australis TaxID=286156 RepID=UPI0013F4DFD2|nr:hypothetical protein [Photorhabdus australis]
MKKIVVYLMRYLMNSPQDWINDDDDNKYIDENRDAYNSRDNWCGVCIFSYGISLFYLDVNIRKSISVCDSCRYMLGIFCFLLLYNRKNKRKMPIVSVSVNKDISDRNIGRDYYLLYYIRLSLLPTNYKYGFISK